VAGHPARWRGPSAGRDSGYFVAWPPGYAPFRASARVQNAQLQWQEDRFLVNFRPCKRCLNLNLSIKLWCPPSIAHFTARRAGATDSCCPVVTQEVPRSPLQFTALRSGSLPQLPLCFFGLQSVSLRSSVFSPLLHFLFF